MTTTGSHRTSWPFIRLTLPHDADDEHIGRMAQAAADHGALGTQVGDYGLVVYLPREIEEGRRTEMLESLAAEAHALGWEFIAPQIESLEDAPWATAWKERFYSFAIGRRLLIRPDWEVDKPAGPRFAGRVAVFLRPGLGFGTGHHETTRLALLLLEDRLRAGDAVLDVGSGSGVLSIAAIRLGAGRVAALEFDPEANQNAMENFILNGVHDRIELVESKSPKDVSGPFNLIVCNMIPQQSVPLLPELVPMLDGADSRLILTGFLTDQKEEVEASLEVAGLRWGKPVFDGVWGGVCAGRG